MSDDEITFLSYDEAMKIVGAIQEEEDIEQANKRILTVYSKDDRELCWFDFDEVMADVGEVEACLEALADRDDGPFVVRLAREPGKRESRYAHLFSGEVQSGAAATSAAADPDHSPSLGARVYRLEQQVADLAEQLGRRSTGQTFYILDEPTTGLHFDDIRKLLEVLNRLVGQGNTVIVIEHNLDVIKTADWIIDLGPEVGDGGGRIVAQGIPEAVAQTPASYTGQFLREVLA
mgnify:CR=1 FL=1